MNIRRTGRHTVDILFLVSLFGAFIVSALLIVVFGARVYQSTVSSAEQGFTTRTSLAYVTEKIRQHDEDGSVSVTETEGKQVLCLSQNYGNTRYITYLYYDNGCLKELTVDDFYTPSLSEGQEIIAVTDFQMEKINDSLYAFQITDTEGETVSFHVAVYSENREVGAL